MHLILHTFRKDIRHLWPAVAVTCLMLGELGRQDRWRADSLAAPLEGWLNLLLTMAWSMLADLAVLEEPLVGERNFWTTRPHHWPALLASKLVFVLVTIHLPLLLADLYVLAARGFSPANALGPILWKQLLFFGAVTLPSIALASLLRNFTHFVIAVFAIAAGIAILNDGFQRFPDFPRLEINLTHAAIRMLLAAAALAVIWTQYARRRVIPARVTAIAAMLAAASLSAWLPARASYAFIGSSSPETPRISLRSSPTVPSPSTLARFGGAQTVALLPIAIAAAPAGHFRIPFVEVEIVLPDRARLRSAVPSPNRPFERIDFTAYAFCNPPDWLALRFSGQAWERVRNARVRIHGTAAFDFCRPGETAVLFPDGSADIPGMGRCTAMTVDDRYGEQILKVFCESPRNLPAASIALRHEPSGREWRLGLNSASTYSPGPHETWLSPLHRGQSFFRLTTSVESAPGSRWLVPVSDLPSARIEITPEIVTGHALAHFDLGEVTLASFLARH
jgi:hypothetical protein